MIEKTEKQYLTVKEFAELAGISRQAVYSQLSTRLVNFTCQVDNKTMIDKSALKAFYSSQVEQVSSQVDSQVDKQKNDNKSAVSGQDQLQGQADVSKELIEMLKEEIKKKDQQIEKLQQRLDHAQDLIADMAQKAQYITAADKTEKILLQQQPKEEHEIVSHAAENQNTEERNIAEEKPKKKWFQFWKRS